jgi:inorganic pyrophosphatase
MSELTAISNQLDEKACQCRAVIESPKGSRNKYDYDPESGAFQLAGLLPEGMMFPFDFGFIPSTLGEDGDPLDIMVITDAPAQVGILMDVRIVGVIEATQTENGKTERNDRLLGVAVHSYNHSDVTKIDDVSKTLLNQVEAFFISYNQAARQKVQGDRHRRAQKGHPIPIGRHGRTSQEVPKTTAAQVNAER